MLKLIHKCPINYWNEFTKKIIIKIWNSILITRCRKNEKTTYELSNSCFDDRQCDNYDCHDSAEETNTFGGANKTTTNEDAEDIAGKLFGQSIKLDPTFWLNKSIQEYRSQFNATVVKDGILTQDEVQYVSWGNMNINFAGYFVNKLKFTVTKDGATATGSATIDADSGSTTAQIAAKINEATNIKFNYNYWNNKTVQSDLVTLRNILVNDHVLTKAEASVITGMDVTTITKVGQITLNLNANDYKTSSNATLHADVVDDGDSAVQIANSLNGYGFGLKTNTAGMYADSNYVEKNFADLAVANYGLNAADLDYVTLPHLQLATDNPQTPITVAKDGQIVHIKMDFECKTGPYMYYYTVNNNHFQVYVNLNPYLVEQLKKYFPDHGHQNDLEYFYSMLDDSADDALPKYSGTLLIPWANRLDNNMGDYGDQLDKAKKIIKAEANAGSDNTMKEFEEQLATAVNNSNGYLSVMFKWSYVYHVIKSDYYVDAWKFW